MPKRRLKMARDFCVANLFQQEHDVIKQFATYVTQAAVAICVSAASTAWAVPVFMTFEAAGSNAAAITATRDAFRSAVGGHRGRGQRVVRRFAP